MENILKCFRKGKKSVKQKEKIKSQEDEINRLAMTFNSGAIL